MEVCWLLLNGELPTSDELEAFEETDRSATFDGKRSIGLEVRTAIAETGVVGILRAPAPREPAVATEAGGS